MKFNDFIVNSMHVWETVLTTAPRFRGQLDELLPEAKKPRATEGNGASNCQRYRGAAVLSIPTNSHEITVLLPN